MSNSLLNDSLEVSLGQCSSQGRKAKNQDFHGAALPQGAQRNLKGVAIALADGISSSEVSQIASETAVKTFLEDYFSTSDTWTVQRSANTVITTINSWLYAQTERSPIIHDHNKGYVCTFSALILKAGIAHLFHLGDSRIYRLNDQGVEQLSKDHRVWLSSAENYLSRALGMTASCEIDYQALPIKAGDCFIIATDGAYEFLDQGDFQATLENNHSDLNAAAEALANSAFEAGSDDNITLQILRVDTVPSDTSKLVQQQVEQLPFPPELTARMEFDGYTIIRPLHNSSRSHVYLASDNDSGRQVAIKTPSIDLRNNAEYLQQLLMEEWVARRINSAHVLKAGPQQRQRNYLYTVSEYVEGQTLAQWMVDNPRPDIETVRSIIEQVAKGLRAFHRLEMLHQDLRPANVIITPGGTVKIIDFGAVHVAGLEERNLELPANDIRGTALYTAPEYFLGYGGSVQAEQFSLGVMTYAMLSGKYPYGTKVAAATSTVAQRRLKYRSLADTEHQLPAWIDGAIRKATDPNPLKRYDEITEFLHDLRIPNSAFLRRTKAPLLERNPVAFWQGVSLLLALVIAGLLANS